LGAAIGAAAVAAIGHAGQCCANVVQLGCFPFFQRHGQVTLGIAGSPVAVFGGAGLGCCIGAPDLSAALLLQLGQQVRPHVFQLGDSGGVLDGIHGGSWGGWGMSFKLIMNFHCLVALDAGQCATRLFKAAHGAPSCGILVGDSV
jgi:hypothetical protein